MFFDTHCHVNFKAFNSDRDEVLARCGGIGMKLMNIGAAFETSERGVAIALRHEYCYAAVGLHPIHVYDEVFDPVAYQELISRGGGKVKAVGETGIDYFHIKEQDAPFEAVVEKQREVFEQHIELAKKNNLALVIHGRNGEDHSSAYEMIYAIAKNKIVERAVVHCFGGSLDEARRFLELGFCIGFTGIVTFDTTRKLDELLKLTPLDRIVIETDAPYLTPVPHRGKRNEPVYVAEVAKHVANVKNVSVERITAQTAENACKLYGIT